MSGESSTVRSQPKPVQKCPCGEDCAWCIGANKARAAFPRAKSPPAHDSDGPLEHHCGDCLEKLALASPDATIFECNPSEVPDDV